MGCIAKTKNLLVLLLLPYVFTCCNLASRIRDNLNILWLITRSPVRCIEDVQYIVPVQRSTLAPALGFGDMRLWISYMQKRCVKKGKRRKRKKKKIHFVIRSRRLPVIPMKMNTLKVVRGNIAIPVITVRHKAGFDAEPIKNSVLLLSFSVQIC